MKPEMECSFSGFLFVVMMSPPFFFLTLGAAKLVYQSINININYHLPIPGPDNDIKGTYGFNVVGTCFKLAEGALVPLPAKIVINGISYLTGVVESWSYGEYGGVYISPDGTNPQPGDAPSGSEN